jgi:hypothetical protein
MTISYPLTAPVATRGPRGIRVRPRAVVGMSESPFTREQQVYAHQGETWLLEVDLPPMKRANAEEWVGFLLALNGREGTFLMGETVNTSPRGTWSGGSPLVAGASQTGKVLNIDGLSAGATGKRGDWFQLGSGSSTRLHKLTADFTANGSGEASIDFWPRLRSAPGDNDPLDISSPVGIWRLAANEFDWDIERAQIYGISFQAIEAI